MVRRELKWVAIFIAVLAAAALIVTLLGMKNGFGVKRDHADGSLSSDANPSPLPKTLQPDSLQITKHFDMNLNKPAQTYMVDDAAMVMRIYRTMLEMEPLKKDEIYHCPMDNGSSYQMKFGEHGREELDANAEISGCQFITLHGVGLRSNEAFWQLMRQTDPTQEPSTKSASGNEEGAGR